MELLGHSVTHFVGRDELDRKLFILHVCNSVELLLKDMLLDNGKSIYKNPKETVTIWGCIEELQKAGIAIPYLNKIELLIDERNALQHRFGSPNELTTIFYQAISFDFFRDILKIHYNLILDEVLEQFADTADLASLKVREPSNDSELDKLKKLSSGHPLAAFLAATSFLENTVANFLEKLGFENDRMRRPMGSFMSHRRIESFGVEIPAQLGEKLDQLRQLRSYAVHGQRTPTTDEVANAIDTIAEFERFLSGVNITSAKEAARKYLEERAVQMRASRNESIIRSRVVTSATQSVADEQSVGHGAADNAVSNA